MPSFAQSIVMRSTLIFEIENPSQFAAKLLSWCSQYQEASYLNSNVGSSPFSKNNSYDLLVAFESLTEINLNSGKGFEHLKTFYEDKKDWLFGYLAFDLKNEIEQLTSKNQDHLHFPELHFFQPRYVISIVGHAVKVYYLSSLDSIDDINLLVEKISKTSVTNEKTPITKAIIETKVSRENYLNAVGEIKKHIQRGDIYEMNYCVEFFIASISLNPVKIYTALNSLSQTPFSCLYRNKTHYLMCASPERFLKKEGTRLLSQPIKGTRKRGFNAEEDELLKKELAKDPKEQSENVMIVDLVRNDLSRSAARGSVKVDELFGVYTFNQVHQLISSISCELKPEIHFVDAIKNAFPMGSMTGAPKVRAMQLIELFESTKRGLYSGAVGYISPEGNFDFNVVIRSILYNATNEYTSFMVGSAITANSNAEMEYEECLIKAEAMLTVLKAI